MTDFQTTGKFYSKTNKDDTPIKNLYQIKLDNAYSKKYNKLIKKNINFPIYKTNTDNYYLNVFINNKSMDLTARYSKIHVRFFKNKEYINCILEGAEVAKQESLQYGEEIFI